MRVSPAPKGSHMTPEEKQLIYKYLNELSDIGGLPQMWNDHIRIFINTMPEEKVDNIFCGECGEFIGVGIVIYNTNAMPEESECWACKNSGVVYADYEPQDCPCCAMLEESDNGCWNCKHMYDIPYEAKLCKVSEYPEGGAMECWEVAGCKNWLDQGGE